MPITQKKASEKSRVEQRRERLQMQQKRHAAATEPDAAPAEEPKQEGGGGFFAGMSGGGGGFQHVLQNQLNATGQQQMQQRQQIMLRIYGILTNNAASGAEMVPNTPFTVEGVTTLMDMLRTRAANEEQTGAAMAGGFINYLKPVTEDQPTVSGASVEKLQLLARMAGKSFAPPQQPM